jgi:hypothetical protein
MAHTPLSLLGSASALLFLLLSAPALSAQEGLSDQEAQTRQGLLRALDELSLEETQISERARLARADCLARWVSSACLEAVRQQRAREERALQISRETLAESVRRIDASARHRARAARQEELNAR